MFDESEIFLFRQRAYLSVLFLRQSPPQRFPIDHPGAEVKICQSAQDSLTRTYGAPNRSIFLLYFYGPVYFYMVNSSFYVVNFLLFISIKSYIEEM